MAITDILEKILKAQKGRDMRQAIHDGIKQCYEDGKSGAVDLEAREELAKKATIDDRNISDTTTYSSGKIQEIVKDSAYGHVLVEKIKLQRSTIPAVAYIHQFANHLIVHVENFLVTSGAGFATDFFTYSEDISAALYDVSVVLGGVYKIEIPKGSRVATVTLLASGIAVSGDFDFLIESADIDGSEDEY